MKLIMELITTFSINRKLTSLFSQSFRQDKCKHYRVENEGGSPVTAYAKVTGCTDMGTCLRLAHSEWVAGGG